MSTPVDCRHEVARYMRSVIAALHMMDKAASSLNELAMGADAAHKRLVDGEFSHVLDEEEREKADTTKHVHVRHEDLLDHSEAVLRSVAILQRVVAGACEKLALVMHHHLIVSSASRALSKEQPMQMSTKYSPERLWASIQKVLIEMLEHFLFDVTSSQISDEVATMAPMSVAAAASLDVPLFRFAASSAAYSASTSSSSSASASVDKSTPSSAKSRAHLSPLSPDFAFVVSPGQQLPSAARLSLLHPSPFCFPAILPLLRAFDTKMRAVVAVFSSRDASASSSPSSPFVSPELGSWLDNFVASVYVPRVRLGCARALQRALASGDGGARIGSVLGPARVLMRMLEDVARDVDDAPAGQTAGLVGAAEELVGMFARHAEQKVTETMLHTETFRRLKGTPVLEMMAKDPQTFGRDFRAIERRYLEGGKTVGADDVIREPSELTSVALLGSSLDWLKHGIAKVPVLATNKTIAESLSAMYLNCVASMKLELRHQCFFYLSQLNAMSYHGAAPTSDPDPCVRNLVLALSQFQEVLTSDSAAVVVEGLSELIVEILISAAKRFDRIDSAGAHKMQLNVFLLQQRLSGSLFKSEEDERLLDSVVVYYGLVDLPLAKIVRGILENTGPLFTLEQYVTLLSRRADELISVSEGELREQLEAALSAKKND